MAMVKDPVCGMEIDSSQAAAQTVHEGRAYYFCSEECRQTFLEDPEDLVRSDDELRGSAGPRRRAWGTGAAASISAGASSS